MEEYKSLGTKEEREKKAIEVMKKYIIDSSPSQVNLTAACKNTLITNFHKEFPNASLEDESLPHSTPILIPQPKTPSLASSPSKSSPYSNFNSLGEFNKKVGQLSLSASFEISTSKSAPSNANSSFAALQAFSLASMGSSSNSISASSYVPEDVKLFNAAQSEAFKLLASDSYPVFLLK